MKLKKVTIENFRGLQKVDLELDETTVLIGENNTGKTSILEAVRLCLGRTLSRSGSVFEEYDYYLKDRNAQPGEAGSMVLTFRFYEDEGEEWEEDLARDLDDVIVFNDELRTISFRVTSGFDEATKDFVTDWEFLDAKDKPLSPKTKQPRILNRFQQFCPVFYLSATRDAVKDFGPRSLFWAPFLRNPDIDPQVREALERELSELNEKIIDAHQSLKDVSTNLMKTGQVVSLGKKHQVTIEALPGRAFDALSRAQVSISGTTGAPLPLGRHGAGTQSLSVMFLFESFLKEMLTKSYDAASSPIMTLEEPEAHLHPSAIRTLWKSLHGMKGQKIIATHSGDLLAEVPLKSIRRLCRNDGGVELRKIQIENLTDNEQRKLLFHIRYARGELFFARCWVLVEGETEHHILTCLAEMMGEGYDLEKYGVRVVTTKHVGIEVLLKVADDLGIAWHCLADGDNSGQIEAQKVKAALAGRRKSEHLAVLPDDNIEIYLCKNGFGNIYESHISPQKHAQVMADHGTTEYWKQVVKAKDRTPKPQIALEVAEKMGSRSIDGAPEELKDVIKAAINLAKGQ
uniref:DNA replication and repair protein RecF n=1 Tax=Candidatus Methanogaster sp. ANME-2c ERB4 TaxID=2759911 RepID=A0A7G9Y0B4_9EURY|nr:DNA replication and repair protein RecF [Methanosarcinales archaeon ANME-2c ERB4]QNO41950.1 DNA replication and repair protein RecF [Methanosarcinales archaeon ANME-2c ERB4]QNO48278.1 DNA replication and repair protein RecF [Methanosarcinales archaeon ANME-2c ERB4]